MLFEIVKIFIEQTFKLISVDNLLKSRERRQLSSLGVELFSFYTALNAIYVTGLLIVKDLEETIDRWDRYQKEKRPEKPIHFYRFQSLLQLQLNNIVSFGNLFIKLSRHIDIIDPDAARNVALFLSTKRNIIGILTSEMSNVVAPLPGQQNPPRVLSASFEKSLVTAVRQAKVTDLNIPHDINSRLLDSIPSNPDDIIEVDSVSAKEITALKSYLSEREPKKHLEELRLILERLHGKIIANFEVKDILLRAGQDISHNSFEGYVSSWDVPLGIPGSLKDESRSQEILAPTRAGKIPTIRFGLLHRIFVNKGSTRKS